MKVSRTWRLFGLALGLWLLDQPSARADDSLRIRIYADRTFDEATFRSVTAPLSVSAFDTGRRIAVVPARTRISVRQVPQGLRVRWPGGEAFVRALRLEASAGSMIEVAVDGLKQAGPARSYRGSVSVHGSSAGDEPAYSNHGLVLVNDVGVDDYVAAVLPAEYPFRAPAGMMAQAVVIRTYALGAPRKFGTLFDLDDTELSQVYRGAEEETPASRRAAEATRGQVLRYEGRLIEAVYSSQCGGHSADNESIWHSAPQPYLRGKPDPYERDTPQGRWTVALDRKKLHAVLTKRYGFDVREVRTETTGRDGRVRAVRLSGDDGRTITGASFRKLVNGAFGSQTLRSTYFTVRPGRRAYQVEGRGFGHGVGMCQYGADARARAGHSYEDILAFYYSGVSLDDRPIPDPAPPVNLASATPAAPPVKPETLTQPIAAHRTTGWARQVPATRSRPTLPSLVQQGSEPGTDAGEETGRRIGW